MVVVKQIEPNSLGERAGFCVGDRILRINGEEVRDLIDAQVRSAEEVICVEIERGRELYEAEIERRSGESLGLIFEDMRLRSCNNKCVFCFIHQMPKGMRRSLYFEDDDFRLSFLHGSYVTLTNRFLQTGDGRHIAEGPVMLTHTYLYRVVEAGVGVMARMVNPVNQRWAQVGAGRFHAVAGRTVGVEQLFSLLGHGGATQL